jgi:hypothetical protein
LYASRIDSGIANPLVLICLRELLTHLFVP